MMKGILSIKGKGLVRLAFAAGLTASCLFLAAAGTAAAERKDYRIGALFATSGGAAMLGEPEELTAEMVAEQINAAGGVAGKPVRLILYDTEGDPTKAHSAAKKLIDKDEVDVIIGPTTSGESLAIADLVEQEKIALVSCAASHKIVNPLREYVYKVTHSDGLAVEKIYEHIRKGGKTRVALITVSDGFGDSGRAELLRLASAYGLEIAADERYRPADTDMTVQLTKIKGSGAEAIVCWGTNPGPAQIARNRKQLGITLPLYNSHGIASKAFIEQAAGSAEGTYLPAGKLLVVNQLPDGDPQKEAIARYKADYEGRYNKPVNTFGGHAFDAMHLVAGAIARAAGNGEVTRASIRNEIEREKEFLGVAGTFTLSADDHNGLTKDGLVMLRVQDGDFVLTQ